MRLPLAVRRLGYQFRGGFLIRPVLIALGLGATGAILSAVEEAVPAITRAVPSVLFPSSADPQVAQVILACIATSTMTIVSIVFAILLLTLTWDESRDYALLFSRQNVAGIAISFEKSLEKPAISREL